MGIGIFDAVIMLDDPLRRLRPHAGHAGDVVAAVAHQSLQVDKLLRGNAPLHLHLCRGVPRGLGLSLHGLRQRNPDMRIRQLQKVPVAGNDGHLMARCLHALRHGAENVIRLIALQCQNGNVHALQQLLHQRHLLQQLRRHGLSRALVAVKHFVSEGRLRQIKGHRQVIRAFLLQHLQQNVHKAEDAVDVLSLGIAELRYAVEGPG